jgi:hypothetical protein
LNAARLASVEQIRQLDLRIRRLERKDPSTSFRPSDAMADRSLVSELACATRQSERAANGMLNDACILIGDLPDTFDALAAGDIYLPHAQTMALQTVGLEPDARAELEAQLLPLAKTLTPPRFKARARVLREKRHPETMAKRHEDALDEQYVAVTPLDDGMAMLELVGPAIEVMALHDRVTTIARTLQKVDGETRPLGRLRATVLLALGLKGVVPEGTELAGIGDLVAGEVHLLVPVLSLLGADTAPATLDGYGPIDAETAARLVAAVPTFRRVLTDPVSGAVLALERTRYKVPKALRDWIRIRDGVCRFIGCPRPAGQCDMDHVLPWELGGPTNASNLAAACEGHHTMKHAAGWRERLLPNGTVEWTTPNGLTYASDPAPGFDPAPSVAQLFRNQDEDRQRRRERDGPPDAREASASGADPDANAATAPGRSEPAHPAVDGYFDNGGVDDGQFDADYDSWQRLLNSGDPAIEAMLEEDRAWMEERQRQEAAYREKKRRRMRPTSVRRRPRRREAA